MSEILVQFRHSEGKTQENKVSFITTADTSSLFCVSFTASVPLYHISSTWLCSTYTPQPTKKCKLNYFYEVNVSIELKITLHCSWIAKISLLKCYSSILPTSNRIVFSVSLVIPSAVSFLLVVTTPECDCCKLPHEEANVTPRTKGCLCAVPTWLNWPLKKIWLLCLNVTDRIFHLPSAFFEQMPSVGSSPDGYVTYIRQIWEAAYPACRVNL